MNNPPFAAVGNESWLAGVESRKVRTRLELIHVRLGGNPNGPVLVCWSSLLMDGREWRHQ